MGIKLSFFKFFCRQICQFFLFLLLLFSLWLLGETCTDILKMLIVPVLVFPLDSFFDANNYGPKFVLNSLSTAIVLAFSFFYYSKNCKELLVLKVFDDKMQI